MSENEENKTEMYGPNAELYDAWIDCYDPNHIELLAIQKQVSLFGKKILDIGCGTGRFFFNVLPIAGSVIGVDPDQKAIKRLRKKLEKTPAELKSKALTINKPIEECTPQDLGSVDVAVFSWSFYALDQEQLLRTARLLRDVLQRDGSVVILQPVGGVFEEKIMRRFFDSNEGMEEYERAITNLNNILPWFFNRITLERISSEFCTSDLHFLTEALQMFASTEGGKEDTSDITEEAVLEVSSPYRDNTGVFKFSDEVDMYVLKKRG